MTPKPEHPEKEPEPSLESEKAARAAAEAASRMKDEFLATISHELRTPLTAILLWSRILREGKISEEDRREAVETIERSAMAQAEMIEDLLDISRMLSGKIRLNAKRMELTPVVQAAARAAQVMAEGKGISLETQLAANGTSAYADPVRIQQVVWNLLTNAIHTTDKGGSIRVSLGTQNGNVRLQVIDNGRGIHPAALASVFDGVARDGNATRQRAALGLVLARQLVELHGGKILAESKGEGAGATFTVDLPTESAGKEPAAARRAGGRSGGGNAPSELLKGLLVVLVEDEADTRNVIRWILEQSGAEVQAVDTAARAMEILTGGKLSPDVLVGDIGMAGEDGNDLIRKIRALDSREYEAARIPAIAITAYASDVDRRRALRAGYTAFLPKPIEAEELVLLIASLAGRGKPTRPAK